MLMLFLACSAKRSASTPPAPPPDGVIKPPSSPPPSHPLSPPPSSSPPPSFVHELALDLEHNRVVVHNPPNHIARGLFLVMATDHLNVFVKGWFEKVGNQLPLAGLDAIRAQPYLPYNTSPLPTPTQPHNNPNCCRFERCRESDTARHISSRTKQRFQSTKTRVRRPLRCAWT